MVEWCFGEEKRGKEEEKEREGERERERESEGGGQREEAVRMKREYLHNFLIKFLLRIAHLAAAAGVAESSVEAAAGSSAVRPP